MKNAGHKKWAVFTLSKLFTHVLLYCICQQDIFHFGLIYIPQKYQQKRLGGFFLIACMEVWITAPFKLKQYVNMKKESMNIQLHLWSGHSTAEFSKGFYALRVQPFNNGFWADLGHFQVTTLFSKMQLHLPAVRQGWEETEECQWATNLCHR